MGAGSKFFDPLTLIDQGRKVVACGPLRFHACDVSAQVAIDLLQPGGPGGPARRALGSQVCTNPNHIPGGSCEEPVGDDDTNEWMIDAVVQPALMTHEVRSAGWSTVVFEVTPPGELVLGIGVIRYLREDGTKQPPFHWTQDGLHVVQ